MKYLHIELYYGESHYLTEEEFLEARKGLRCVVTNGSTVYMGEESLIVVIEG